MTVSSLNSRDFVIAVLVVALALARLLSSARPGHGRVEGVALAHLFALCDRVRKLVVGCLRQEGHKETGRSPRYFMKV